MCIYRIVCKKGKTVDSCKVICKNKADYQTDRQTNKQTEGLSNKKKKRKSSVWKITVCWYMQETFKVNNVEVKWCLSYS